MFSFRKPMRRPTLPYCRGWNTLSDFSLFADRFEEIFPHFGFQLTNRLQCRTWRYTLSPPGLENWLARCKSSYMHKHLSLLLLFRQIAEVSLKALLLGLGWHFVFRRILFRSIFLLSFPS